MTHSTRPVFWAGLVGFPLVLVTGYAYYFWCQVLVARGFGYMFDDVKYSGDFRQARLFLLVTLVCGVMTFESTRQFLSKGWRVGYVIIIGMGIALFVVQWVVDQFGPTTWWHHP